MIVPTGVGAELGGHAGDACPVARLLGEACDTLILHPNVVNASDLNELPTNAMYVEGSVLTPSRGEMVNPWGGVEAMFTHAITSLYDLPTAHSPMFESQDIASLEVGIVDPRMAAEAVSLTFLNCILKGLHQSPQLITSKEAMAYPGVLSAEQVSVLVQPDGCLGLPTLAALEQGIKVIAVKENRTIMANDLGYLPWRSGQFWQVDNYWEAAGLMLAFKAGVDPRSTRRPLAGVQAARLAPSVKTRGVSPAHGTQGDHVVTS